MGFHGIIVNPNVKSNFILKYFLLNFRFNFKVPKIHSILQFIKFQLFTFNSIIQFLIIQVDDYEYLIRVLFILKINLNLLKLNLHN